MTALDATHAANLMDASLGTATIVATVTPLKARLVKTTPTASSNGTIMTGLTAQTVTFGASTAGAAGASSALSFSGLTPGEVALGLELWDNAGTPKRKQWAVLNTPVTVDSTGTIVIAAGGITPAFA